MPTPISFSPPPLFPILTACVKSAKFAPALRLRRTLLYFVVHVNRPWKRACCPKATSPDGHHPAPLHKRKRIPRARVRKRTKSVRKNEKRSPRRSCRRTGIVRITRTLLPLLPIKRLGQPRPLIAQRRHHHKGRILRRNPLNKRSQQQSQ